MVALCKIMMIVSICKRQSIIRIGRADISIWLHYGKIMQDNDDSVDM